MEGKGLGVIFQPHGRHNWKSYENGEIYLFFSKCITVQNSLYLAITYTL